MDTARDRVTLRAQWSAVEQATHYRGEWWTSMEPSRSAFRTTHDFYEWQALLAPGTRIYLRIRTCSHEGCSRWSRTAQTRYDGAT